MAQSGAKEGVFASYRAPAHAYDEMYGHNPGILRDGWSAVVPQLDRLGLEGIDIGSQLVGRLVRRSSITTQVPGSRQESLQRPWDLDALPWIISAEEWETLSAGLRQRAKLLNRILEDLYGPQRLICNGLLPPAAIYSNPAFARSFHGISVPRSLYLHFYTADLVRDVNGKWLVSADRTDAPLGLGYTLENRLVLSRTYPNIFHDSFVQRLAPFFIQLRKLLSELSPANQENPRVALLTQGPGTDGYFEDVYLARYLGYNLVESGDLTVRDDRLLLKTLGGLLGVDVLFRRMSDQLCDPLELQSDAALGIAGLSRAARAGNVLVVNALGSSLVESAVMMPFLDGLCHELMNEPLKIASIPTWWCGLPEHLDYVLQNQSELTIGGAFRQARKTLMRSFSEPLDPSIRASILKHESVNYIARAQVNRSVVPCYDQGLIRPMHAALRVYLVAEGDDYRVLPGGLARVATDNESLEKELLQGKNSKEVWVLSNGPVPPVSLLSNVATPKKEFGRKGSELTSRVADNLLWLGRYVERVDGSSRVLRTALMRLARESNAEALPEWPGLVRQLADRGLVEPGYVLEGMKNRLPRLSHRLPTIAIDEHQSGNLRDSLRQIVRIASILRDRLSPDSWQVLYFLESRLFGETTKRSREPDDAIGILSQLIVDLSAFIGMTAESMTRTIGWRILDLGRRLERAFSATSIVRQLVDPSCTDPAEWEALVESSDSLMTYRFRYLASWSLDAVLDLLLTDKTNPRSVAFQLAAISEHVQELIVASQYSSNSPEKQLANKMRQMVEQIDVQLLAEAVRGNSANAMIQNIDALGTDLARLADLFNARYVVHLGPVRNRGK